MAVNFTADHTRTSEYLFLPEAIKIKAELNGRHDLPDIEHLISSMVSSGQLQPVLIGNDGGTPVLYAGHSRWRAALEINKRKLTPVPFKLRCVYFKGSEHEAFLATVRENRDRNATTPMDDAHNIAKLERYGMTLDQIASEIYHEEIRWVKDRLALIELCEDAAKAVRSGEIKKISAAVALAKLSKSAQKDALKKAVVSGSQITVASLKQNGNGVSTGRPTASARLSAVESALRQYVEYDLLPEGLDMDHFQTIPDALHAVLGAMLDSINGKTPSGAAAE